MSNMSAETFSTCKLLDVRGLRVSFDAVDVLHGVDLTVHCGRIHALIGESGSGKSVLARSILGLAGRGARTTGSIRFLGRELVDLSEREYRAIPTSEAAPRVLRAAHAPTATTLRSSFCAPSASPRPKSA